MHRPWRIDSMYLYLSASIAFHDLPFRDWPEEWQVQKFDSFQQSSDVSINRGNDWNTENRYGITYSIALTMLRLSAAWPNQMINRLA
jgi:hypothetical protein